MADLRDYTKKNIIFAGTDGIRLPTGNNAQRTATSNVAGTMRYNSDIGGLEVYSPNGWTPLAAPPTITTVTPSTFNGTSGTQFVVNGTNFTSDALVYFVTAQNIALLAASVTYISPVEIRATTPRAITVQEEPISVRVTQQSGTTTKVDCVDAGGLPTWVTTAGTLGSIFGANTINVYVTATDPEGTAVSYQLSTGSLPGGVSLSSNGLIQGVATAVTANTTYNFVIKANDTVNNNTDRSFSYTVLNRAPLINTAAGSLGTIYSGNAVPSTTISAYDPDGGTITFSAPTGNIVNTTIGSANGTIVGTPIVVTTNTTYTIGVTVTDQGSLTASNNYTFRVLNRPPVWNTAASLPSIDDQYGNTITINAYDPDGGSVSYTLDSGTLPSGLSFNTSNGTITGSAPTVTSNQTSTFTVTATDVGNDSNTRTFTLVVTEPVDPYFANTVLLIHSDSNTSIKDASSNNNVLVPYGDTRVTNFSPYNSSRSVYFDGSSYMTLSSNTDFSYGTGDFSMECWIFTSNASSQRMITHTEDSFNLDYNSSGQIQFFVAGVGALTTTSPYYLESFKWHHVAVTRSGSALRIFTNGKLAYYNSSMTANKGTGGLCIGHINGGGIFNGHIADVRVVKGGIPSAYFTFDTALGSQSFSPPTSRLSMSAPLTGGSVVALMCNNPHNTDATYSPKSVTYNGTLKVVGYGPYAETDSTSGAMYFDGTGDYIDLGTNEPFHFYDQDFTLECWFWQNSVSGGYTPVVSHQGSGDGNGWIIYNETNNYLTFGWSSTGGWTSFGMQTGFVLNANAWHHVVIQRTGGTAGTLNMWVDGILRATKYIGNTPFQTISGGTGTIGRYSHFPGGQRTSSGYICDLRVVKGSAVYTANAASITVPTSPLSNVANTKLLTLQTRQPHNNRTVLDTSPLKSWIKTEGLTSVGTFSPFSAEEGKWSVYFPGTGYISAGSNSAFALGTSDFQIDMWVHMTAYPSTYGALFSTRTGSTGMDIQLYNNSGTYQLMIGNPSGAIISANNVLPLNAWALVTAVRSSGTFYLFIDGSLVASGASSQNFTDTGSYIGTGVSGNNPFTGYISNFRLIKGNALNTTAFTPSTSPLSNVSNTIILACQSGMQIDKSTANNGGAWNLTISGSARTLPYSPFAPSASYNVATKGGSIYFNGVDDELNLVTLADSNRALRPGQNVSTGKYTWTMECWAYPTSESFSIAQKASNSVGAREWYWYSDSTGNGVFFHYRDYGYSDDIKYANVKLKSNSWNYIVMQRNGADVYDFYINGVKYTGGTGSSYGNVTLIENNDLVRIGASTTGAGTPSGGMWYMSDFRFSRDPLYTGSTMNIPTAPLQALANTTFLVSTNTASIFDHTGKNNLVTIGDIKANNSVFKLNGGALTFDGSGDYAYVPSIAPNPLFNFGTGDFTVEMWIYPKSAAAQSCLIDFRASDTSGQGFALNITTSSTLMYYMTASRITSSTITLNTWTHVAITRASGVVRMFVNGTVQGTTYTDTTSHVAQANRPIFGVVNDLSQPYNGLIDEIRITRGYARYVNSFTAPTKSYPNR